MDKKCSIDLSTGVLKYKPCLEYLGVFVSDSGSLKHDVTTYVNHKRSNVSIKYTHFCKTNRNAPLHVKLDVLDRCVSSALIYGCETWGRYVNYVEQPYRSGLKTALNVRVNVNNEIVYVETGRWPLNARIKKAQLKFWLFLNSYKLNHPFSAVAKVLDFGLNNNINYLKYYKDLYDNYIDPRSCQISSEKQYLQIYLQKMIQEMEKDENSKLATYYRINPTLEKFVPKPQNILEIERELTTRYRTGSHSLAIELGRYSNTPRENLICICGNYIQTVWHIFLECPLTRTIVNPNYVNLAEVFADNNLHRKLLLISNKLKVQL